MKSASRRVIVITLVVICLSMVTLQAQDGKGILDFLGLRGGNAAQVEQLEGEYADPVDVMAWVELPRAARLDEEVTLKIEIENGRRDKLLRLSAIEVEEAFLKGFELLKISPEPRHKDLAFGYLSLEYPDDVKAGETVTYEIKLRAKMTGVYIGDVDVHEGQRWLTRAAQIRISD